MKEDNKKIKAAIIACLYLLNEEKKTALKKDSSWSRFGREIIMRNRIFVQRRNYSKISKW